MRNFQAKPLIERCVIVGAVVGFIAGAIGGLIVALLSGSVTAVFAILGPGIPTGTAGALVGLGYGCVARLGSTRARRARGDA